MEFQVIKQVEHARLGALKINQNTIQTPVFMPVATQGTLKSLWQENLEELEYQLILNNTYHLYLRPGTEVLQKIKGMKNFMSWNHSLLTDSGGFQAFSLSKLAKLHSEGIQFKSYLDGSSHFFSPEKVLDIQSIIQSDIVMPLDDCAPHDASETRIIEALKRTHAWFKKSSDYFKIQEYDIKQSLFPIIQGGLFDHLRIESCQYLSEFDTKGIAIGGLSVGESKEDFYRIISLLKNYLPKHKAHYLMGVGTIPDILYAVENGIDMFDCVLPTRNARNAQLFTKKGKINIKNRQYKYDENPIDTECHCKVCKKYSRAYIRHLYKANELLVYSLCTYHNLHFMMFFMKEIQKSIQNNNFQALKQAYLAYY